MKKILVIEDNLEVRENLVEILEISGYEVVSAPDGTEGVEMALKTKPDIILCDVMMPKLDGFGVLNILSKKPATSEIPFVFLTAMADATDFRRGMNLGADDYITKPFYKDELLQVIETRLQKSERLRQKFEKSEAGWSAFINEAKGHEALHKLSEERQVRTIRKKDILFEEESLPRHLYLVGKGKIKLYKTTDFGKELILKICTTGDFIGYTSLIKEEPYNFAAAALEDSEVRVIPKEDFLNLLYADKDVASRLIKMLAENIVEKETELLHLAYHSVRKRVAQALLNLQMRYKNEGREQIPILREDLAHIVGTAKESVIRMLSEFKSDGWIDISDDGIKILNEQKLEGLPG